MPHLHTRPGEHDLTVSAFIVFQPADPDDVSAADPEILMHVHKKLGVLLQPGGHVELDENPWEAIWREIREETGYTHSELRLLQPPNSLTSLSGAELHPQPVCIDTHVIGDLDHKHTDIVYAFTADARPTSLPAEGESTELLWMTRDQLRASGTRTYRNVLEIADFVVDVCLPTWTDSHLQFD